nr:helix-turn-helix domain-containing protein [Leucobacter sp. cx-169]
MDVRRLAEATGYSRSTCARALHALAADGWVERTELADGVHGARWRLNPKKFSTRQVGTDGTQGVTRAPSFGLPRETLLRTLEHRLSLEAQPLFAATGSLGRLAGRIVSLAPGEVAFTLEDLAGWLPLPRGTLLRALRSLHTHGLAAKLSAGNWILQLTEFSIRRATDVLGLTNWSRHRAERLATERYVWSWWTAEVTWMRKRKKRRDRRAGSGSTPLFGGLSQIPSFPRYPRNAKRRGDHALARALAELRDTESLGRAAAA